VWAALHPEPRGASRQTPRVIEHGDVRIEIWFEGDETGTGLVRSCRFRVPKLLLSGGVGRSWECVTESRPPEYSHYEAVGKPLWSEASGTQRIVDLGDQRSRVEFTEAYHAYNPILRLLLERYVHRFISKDNDRLMQQAIEAGVAFQRKGRNRSE
jgi:hypothetical protein